MVSACTRSVLISASRKFPNRGRAPVSIGGYNAGTFRADPMGVFSNGFFLSRLSRVSGDLTNLHLDARGVRDSKASSGVRF
jgi:hypothetical protein